MVVLTQQPSDGEASLREAPDIDIEVAGALKGVTMRDFQVHPLEAHSRGTRAMRESRARGSVVRPSDFPEPTPL